MFTLAFTQMSKNNFLFQWFKYKHQVYRSKLYTFLKLYGRAMCILKAELSHKLLNLGLFFKFGYEDQDGFLKR